MTPTLPPTKRRGRPGGLWDKIRTLAAKTKEFTLRDVNKAYPEHSVNNIRSSLKTLHDLGQIKLVKKGQTGVGGYPPIYSAL